MAGKSAGFAIGVSISDTASAGLDAINKRIAALSAPAERFNKSLAKFGDVTGINKAAEGMQTLGDRTLGAARAVERLAGPMAGITGATSIAGMVELSRKWAEAGNQISKTSNLLNMPVDRLSALRGAARLAGSTAEAMDTSLKGLNETIHAAFFHRDPAAQKALNSIFGPTEAWHDAQGNMTKAETLLGRLADKAKTYADKATAGRALEAVGVDKDLLPLLDKGQAGLDAFVARARQSGGVMTGEMAANAVKMNASWIELGLAIEGVGNRIVDNWSSTATKVLDITSHWIEQNPKLAESFTKVGSALGATLAALSAGKFAIWALRGLGLLGPTEAAIVLGAIGEGAANLPPKADDFFTRQMNGPWTHVNPDGTIGSGPPAGSESSSDSSGPNWWQRSMPTWLGGGGGGGAAEPGKPIIAPRPGTTAAANMETIRAYYKAKGLTDGQIAGRLVNISAESGFDPTAPGDGGTSYGLFQDHNTRLAGLRRWAGTFNPTIQQQLDYEWAEEQPGGERAVAGAALRATTDATQTAMIFSGGIEGPKAGIPEAERRAAAIGQFGGHVEVVVTVRHDGSVTGTVVGTGSVKVSPVRVEHSMPMAGGPGA